MAIFLRNSAGKILITSAGKCLIPTEKKYTVTASSNLFGLQNVWLSTSVSATSGSALMSVTPGTTVYGYAVLGTDTYAANVRNWTLISGTACKQGAIYRVGSKTITAATSFAIELFDSYGIDWKLLFTRSGESVGSWTVESHTIQAMDDQGYFTKEGNSIYFTGDDYNGTAHKALVGTFSCPGGYTNTITITDCDGQRVAWNTLQRFSGPYTIEAETESTSSGQS